jgi:integrase
VVRLITAYQLLDFLKYLRTDYVPRRTTGNNNIKFSDKTVYNIYVALSAFFTWASREFGLPNPMKKILRPRVPENPPVEPLKLEELERLLKACDTCAEAETHNRRKFTARRTNISVSDIFSATKDHSGYFGDGLHPNMVGEHALAEEVIAALSI